MAIQMGLAAALIGPGLASADPADQDLRVLERTPEGIRTTRLFPVRFVPFVRGGEDAKPQPVPAPTRREAP